MFYPLDKAKIWCYNEIAIQLNYVAEQDRAEHTANAKNFCSICNTSLGTEGIVYQLSKDGTQASVTGYTGTSTTVYIASSYQGVPVTSIVNEAFYGCTNLTIYCEAASKPSGWASNWNYGRPVVWGYTGE